MLGWVAERLRNRGCQSSVCYSADDRTDHRIRDVKLSDRAPFVTRDYYASQHQVSWLLFVDVETRLFLTEVVREFLPLPHFQVNSRIIRLAVHFLTTARTISARECLELVYQSGISTLGRPLSDHKVCVIQHFYGH